MAHLEVKPKKRTAWWLWLLLVIIAIALILFLFKGCGQESGLVAGADSTDTSMDKEHALASTGPDWNTVDFAAPESSDPDITDKDISVRGNDNYTIYSLGENILFGTDQNVVQGSAEAKLKQILTALNRRFKGAAIGVYGSTDSTGTASHNKQLGAERAGAVREWLVKTGGFDQAMVSIHSLGEKEPVASNATTRGRQENRNVQIVAFPSGK